MKHTLFILALITATIQTFAQSPRIKLNQITKDSLTGSVLISSPTDSGMVYSRDLFISYGADTVLILGGDTLAATSGTISSVLSDGVTITGDGTTGSELTVDTATVIATKKDLTGYVDLTTTQTVGGAKTFSSTVTGTRFDPTSSSTTGTGMFLPTDNTLGFSTNGVEKTRITTLGNLGLNTIPKNNYSGTTTIEIGASAVIFSENTSSIYNSYTTGINFYLDSLANFKYKNTNPAPARMWMYQGTFLFDNAAAGIADSTFSWTRRMTLDANGNLGIGSSIPSYPLEMGSGAHVTTGGVWTDASDIKLKTNINYIYPYGLSEVLNLKPVVFDYINGEKNSLGFIAQDVYEYIPEAISSTLDKYGNETMGLKMVSITSTLTKAIQEQQAIIDQQKSEIETLKTQIQLILTEIEQLKNN